MSEREAWPNSPELADPPGEEDGAPAAEEDEEELERRELEDDELEEEPEAEGEPEQEAPREHAEGDYAVPDGYGVLQGAPTGGRRAVGIVVSRFNGAVTSKLLEVRSPSWTRPGGEERGHGHARPGGVRAPDRRDGAREDAPVRLRSSRSAA